MSDNVDGPRRQYAEWDTPDWERKVPHDFTYMYNLKTNKQPNKRTHPVIWTKKFIAQVKEWLPPGGGREPEVKLLNTNSLWAPGPGRSQEKICSVTSGLPQKGLRLRSESAVKMRSEGLPQTQGACKRPLRPQLPTLWEIQEETGPVSWPAPPAPPIGTAWNGACGPSRSQICSWGAGQGIGDPEAIRP